MENFYKDPMVQILAEINAKNKSTLTRDLTAQDIILVPVSSNDETGEREVIVKPAAGSEYYGAVRKPGVTYKRYVGQKLFVVQPRIWGVEGESYDVLLQRVAETYNLPPFTIEPAAGDTVNPYDFAKEERTRKVEFSGGVSAILQVQFRSDSVGYTNIFPVLVFNADLDLGRIIKNTALLGLRYPDDTEGKAGSMSTLTYPITFEFPSISKEVLAVKGASLSTDVSDATVKAIVDQIFSYYGEDNITDFQRSDIEEVVAGATVNQTNLLDAQGQPNNGDILIILDSTVVSGSKFIGQIYIRNPEFTGS